MISGIDTHLALPAPRLGRTLALYLGSIAVGAAALGLIIFLGHQLEAPPAASATTASPSHGPGTSLIHLLLALAAVLIAGRLLGMVFVRLKQPPVIAEVLAGIMLGPS